MKQFKFLPVILVLAVLLSACGAEPVPTLSPVDVQNTAVAAAFTVVAQTQEAIPTATPLPPTDTPTATPLPTNTPVALPTLGVTATTVGAAAPTSSGSGGDPCATRVLSWSPAGEETIIRIANTTDAEVTVSLYLNETPGKGECGYRSYVLGKKSDVVITDLVQGCYNLWAWSTTGSKTHVNAGGGGCINNPDKWTFDIKEDSIKFTSR